MNWKLEPATYACPEHQTVDLSEQVRLKALAPTGPGTWVGGDFYARRRDVTAPEPSSLRRARDVLLFRNREEYTPEGPFTIRVNCPGIPDSKKDKDKPHRQTFRGVVVK